MQRAHAGEVGDLLPARRAAGDEHRVRAERARGGQQPPLADRPRHLEVVAARSRTIPPCRSIRHRDRRPSRRGCGRAAPWPGQRGPSLSDGSGRGAEPRRPGAQCERRAARPATRLRASPRTARERSATTCARRRSSPRSSDGRVLANRGETAGLEEHERQPMLGAADRADLVLLAAALARLVEQALRNERPAAARRSARASTPKPARFEHVERRPCRSPGESDW